LIILLFCFTIKAQQTSSFSFKIPTQIQFKSSVNLKFEKVTSIEFTNHFDIDLLFNHAIKNKLNEFSSGSIKDLPFFCALECKIRKQANIWVKFRAGDDASYMKMITH
jgi:hypothetical protein